MAGWKHNDFKLFQTFNVCTIFFVSGMTLKTEDVKDAVKGTTRIPSSGPRGETQPIGRRPPTLGVSAGA